MGTGFPGLSWPVLAACEFDAYCGDILTRREPRPPSSGHCAGPGKWGTHMPRDRESGKTSQSSRTQLCRARSTSRNISELSRRQCDEDIRGSRFERCLAPSSQEQPRAAKSSQEQPSYGCHQGMASVGHAMLRRRADELNVRQSGSYACTQLGHGGIS